MENKFNFFSPYPHEKQEEDARYVTIKAFILTFLLLFSLYSAKLAPSWLYVTKYCVTHCAASCRPMVASFTMRMARRKST